MTDYPSVSHIVEKLTLVGIAVLVFEGAFGRKNGFGRLIYPDMRMYEGHFKDDKRVGHGKLFDANGSLEFDGEWVDDVAKKVSSILNA